MTRRTLIPYGIGQPRSCPTIVWLMARGTGPMSRLRFLGVSRAMWIVARHASEVSTLLITAAFFQIADLIGHAVEFGGFHFQHVKGLLEDKYPQRAQGVMPAVVCIDADLGPWIMCNVVIVYCGSGRRVQCFNPGETRSQVSTSSSVCV